MTDDASMIRSVETFVVRMDSGPPTAPDYRVRSRSATVYAAVPETLMVRIETRGGTVGWGEGLAPVAARVPASIIEDLFAPRLIGTDVRRVRPTVRVLAASMSERGHLGGHQADALAAVDIALWDACGKIHNLPVSRLIGGDFRATVPTYLTHLGNETLADLPDAAAKAAGNGVRRIKLHLGNGVVEDLDAFDRVADAAPGVAIAVDVHGRYDRADAARLGRALDDRGAWFLEAPLDPEDLAGHAALARELITPIAGGEGMRHRFEALRWLRGEALDTIQPDIGRTGITEGSIIATLAAAQWVPTIPHHSAALGVAFAAGLHVSATAENSPAIEFSPRALAHANRLLSTPLQAEPAGFAVPTGPGLGVEVDEESVRRLAVSA